MAFVTRGPRDGKDFAAPTSTPEELGPGAYKLPSAFDPVKSSYAPFVSTVEKGSQVPGTTPLLQGAPVGSYHKPAEWTGRPGVTQTGLPCRYVPFKCSSVRFPGHGRSNRVRASE